MSDQQLFHGQDVTTEVQRQLFTGMAKIFPVLLNPTLEELKEKTGIELQQEPSYLGEDQDGNTTFRFQVWAYFKYKNDNGEETYQWLSIPFFTANTYRTNAAGDKSQFINAFGQTAWAASLDEALSNYDWFSEKGARNAYDGEESLINFIRMWGNVYSDAELEIDLSKTFDNRDASAVRPVFKQIKELGNPVEVLLTVRDGQYQSVFGNLFGKANVNNQNKFKKQVDKYLDYLAKQGKAQKEDFQDSLKFQKYQVDADFGQTASKDEFKAQQDDDASDEDNPPF